MRRLRPARAFRAHPVATALGLGVVAFVALVMIRPEPAWQRHRDEHRALLVDRLDARLAAARAEAAPGIEEATLARRAALDALDRPAVDALEREIFRLERQRRAALASREASDDPQHRLERRAEVEGLDEMIAQRRARLDALRADLQIADEALAEARGPIVALQARLEAVASPPSLRALEAQAAGERCGACHLGVLEAPVDDASDVVTMPPLSRPHPLPDLLGPGTAHPFVDVGCTVCHGGDGRSVTFDGAGHGESVRTSDRPGLWSPRIVGGAIAESGCVACHGEQIWLDDFSAGRAMAPQAGLRVAAALGCGGCHQTGRASLDRSAPAGPSLVDLPNRLSRAAAAEHLRDPRALHAGAWMPSLWADADETTRETEIAAVVEALWSSAGLDDATPSSGTDLSSADPERGRRLVESIGCLACHLGPGEATPIGAADSRQLERRRGPPLDLAARLEPAWLVEWLRAPSSLHPSTAMPSLRLDAREARSVAAHLTGSNSDASAPPALREPTADAETRDRLLRRRLLDATNVEATAAVLAETDPDERLLELGRRVLASRCVGCHHLPEGLSATRVTGPSLVDAAARIARLPSLDAQSLDAQWLDRLHPSLGRFELSTELSDALLAQVLGWRGEPVPTIPEGLATMERLGCRACHAVDPASAWAPGWLEASRRPPALTRSGRLLRGPWLAAYLDDPTPRHPDAAPTRMPTFPFQEGAIPRVVEALADLAEVPAVQVPPRIDPIDVAVGRVLFDVLQCDDCHRRPIDADEARREEELSGTVLRPRAIAHEAPPYEGAGDRLRYDALVAWLLEPHALDPHTAMHVAFPPGEQGHPDASYLADTLEAPIFYVPRSRLRRLFASDEDYRATITDADQVARALAAYLVERE